MARLGPFPRSEEIPAARRDAWTTNALLQFLWKDGVSDFSLLWLSEPDDTEHRFAPGSEKAIAALKTSDANFGRVLTVLDRRRVREFTDIFVVSDHGFSTIERAIDLRTILKAAGFDAVTKFTAQPRPGQIMLVGNGGTVLFYVIRGRARPGGLTAARPSENETVVRRLVEFLQQSDFTGVIFTKSAMEGTFGLEKAGMAGNERAPDVAMTFRWNDAKNQFGLPGMIDADWGRKPGKGTHATLSRFDMHNTLIAAGPDFQRGQIDDLPSGNVDLAPTILRIFGITPPKPLDGRVLSEAMMGVDYEVAGAQSETIQATKSFSSGTWQQTLRISRVGSTIYLDEGNGAFVPVEP